MRIGSGVGHPLAAGGLPPRRAVAPTGQPGHAAPGRLDMELPSAVVDRLTDLLAGDPGFADAVTAQLPAARQASARDLGTYGPPRVPVVITRPTGL